jgi:hypothetical protein
VPDDEELRVLDHKMKQLKLDYDRYFLGSRPREPVLLRAELDKLIAVYSNQAIPNIALRFRFSSLCSRYQAFKRQWNETLRKIEQGSYERHRFKADLHERERAEPAGVDPSARPDPTATGRAGPGDEVGLAADLFGAYRAAREACGQDTRSLTPEALERVLERQREALRERYGDAEFRFRVVIEEGRAKIKASRAAAAPARRPR